jgi:hypothetical protein
MPDLTPEQRSASAGRLNQTILERLLAQRDSTDRLEGKGTLLLGFTVGLAQFFAVQDAHFSPFRELALAFYGIAALFGLIVVYPYQHKFPPKPEWFVNQFVDESPVVIDKWLAAARAKAFTANAPAHARKAVCLWWTLLALSLAVICSVLSVSL